MCGEKKLSSIKPRVFAKQRKLTFEVFAIDALRCSYGKVIECNQYQIKQF